MLRLVEQAAAASETMSKQATNLSSLVAFFTIDAANRRKPDEERRSTDRPWGDQEAAPKSVEPTVSHQATGTENSEWEQF